MRITHPRLPRAFDPDHCVAANVDADGILNLDERKHYIAWLLDTGAELVFENLTAWEVVWALESAGWYDAAFKFRERWAEELKPT